MRLICPKCGAQYEVPPEAIPPAGRDVQCSACGTTWFERSSTPEPLPAPEPWDLVPQASDDEEEADDLAEAEAAPPVAAPPRPTVTPEVAGILRAEAEREAQTRREEAARKAVAESTPVRPTPVQPVPPAAPPAPLAEPLREAPRPARLAERPLDIDQINSSLRSANDRIGGRMPQVRQARRGGGFARGFWGAILVLAVLAGLYVTAPNIEAAFPGSAIVLKPYTGAIDGARVWLDRQVGALRGGGAPAD